MFSTRRKKKIKNKQGSIVPPEEDIDIMESINRTISEAPEGDSNPAVLTICFNLTGEQARTADSAAGGAVAGPNGTPPNLTTSALLRAHMDNFFVHNGLQWLDEGVFTSPYPIREASLRISSIVTRYATANPWATNHPVLGHWIGGMYITSTDRTPFNAAPAWGY